MRFRLFSTCIGILAGITLVVLMPGCAAGQKAAVLSPQGSAGIGEPTAASAALSWDQAAFQLPKSPNGINYIFEKLTSGNGLSANVIHVVLQDSYGYIWIGTSDGLNRYDGYHFDIYRNDPEDDKSIIGNDIWSIFEDKYRNLWIGTDDGLCLFDRQSGQFIRYSNNPLDADSISSDRIRSVIEDNQGDLWIGTWGGGLNRYDRHSGIFTHYMFDIAKPGSLSDNYVKTIYEDSKGLIWVATTNGLNRYDPRTGRFIIFQRSSGSPRDITEYEMEMLYQGNSGYFWSGKPSPLDFDQVEANPSLLSNNQVQALIEDTDRRLWIGTAGGLDCLNITNGRFEHFGFDADNAASLSSDTVLSLYIDQSGNLWVGTNNGLNRYDEQTGTFARFGYDAENPADNHSLGSSVVNAITQDDSGAFWISTPNGLNRFDGSTGRIVHNYHDPANPATLSGNMVWAFEEDSNLGYWVATSVGLDRYDVRKGIFTHFVFKTRDGAIMDSVQVYSVFRDHSAVVWAGTSNGLFRYDAESKTFIGAGAEDAGAALSEIIILDIVEQPAGWLWLGTYGSGLIHLNLESGDAEHFTFIQDNASSLSSDIVSSLLVDQDGRLYAGTRGGGLNRYAPESAGFVRYTSDPNSPVSLSENNVTDIYQSADGEIWVATLSGLNRYDKESGRFETFLAGDGLASDVVYGILQDDQGEFWVSTNNGLTRFNPASGEFRSFDYRYGLQANEFNSGSAFVSSSGLLFFGGINGFNVIDPSLLASNPYLAPVLVTQVTQNGKPISAAAPLLAGQEIRLEWPRNYFEFNAAVLNFIQRDENRLQYKLEPYEREWQSMPSYQTASYENLPGGAYSLWLRGANNDGLWSEPQIVLSIEITSPIWESDAFRLGGALFALFVVIAAVWMRVKNVQRYSRMLETQVAERTADIEKRRMAAEGLREILFRLNSDHAIEESLDFVVCQTNRLLRTQAALIFKMAKDGQPEIVAFSQAQDFPLKNPVTRDALKSEVRQWAQQTARSKSVFRTTAGSKLEKYLADEQFYFQVAPIYSMNKALGALAVLERRSSRFNVDDQDLLRSLADQAGLALENANLRASAEEMAVVEERNRIARDLHDAITQTLFSANLIAESLPRVWKKDIRAGERNLTDLQKLNKSALAEMRALLLELRPAVISEIPLADLFEQMADTVRGRTEARVNLDIKDAVRLPDEVHLQVYRITQETLTNIIKHAKADHVHVQLTTRQYKRNDRVFIKLELIIEDDGNGFNPSKVSGAHFGIRDMAERAQGIGADLMIESALGSGTQLKLVWKGLQDGGC